MFAGHVGQSSGYVASALRSQLCFVIATSTLMKVYGMVDETKWLPWRQCLRQQRDGNAEPLSHLTQKLPKRHTCRQSHQSSAQQHVTVSSKEVVLSDKSSKYSKDEESWRLWLHLYLPARQRARRTTADYGSTAKPCSSHVQHDGRQPLAGASDREDLTARLE